MNQILQKVSNAEKTIDPEFEESRNDLESMLRQLNNIRNDLGKFDESLKGKLTCIKL